MMVFDEMCFVPRYSDTELTLGNMVNPLCQVMLILNKSYFEINNYDMRHNLYLDFFLD